MPSMTSKRFKAFPREGLQFLRSLKRNNNREWFQEHKVIYETVVKAPMIQLVETLAEDFQRFAPEMIATPKASIYRIYRDTRFSKDKSPYKTHIAAVFPRKGLEKHEGAGFYLHIAPSELLIGGGVYMPMPDDLNAIRAYLASNHRPFKRIVEAKEFRKLFGELSGEQLSRVPRGFPTDHPAAGYLKFKQFLAGRTLEAEHSLSPKFYGTVLETFRAMLPLIRFLNDPLLKRTSTRKRQEAVLSEA
jgi:uncharacterized protein (TIGR02453 family)